MGQTFNTLKTHIGYKQKGVASWYGKKFHGRLTSTREKFNMYAFTAASPVLPIPCYVKVTNLDNNKTLVVKVNDRGPFYGARVMDLSYAAALKLGYADKGTAKVLIEGIDANSSATLNWRGLSLKRSYEQAKQREMASQKAEAQDRRKKVNNNQSNKYYLQVGTFSNRKNAQKTADSMLKSFGFKAYVIESKKLV